MSVLLPAPFSPRSAWTSPGRRSKSTWSFARTPGKRLTIPVAWMASSGGAAGAAVIRPPVARRGRGRVARGLEFLLRREVGELAGDPLGPPVHADLALGSRRARRELVEVRLLQLRAGCEDLLA